MTPILRIFVDTNDTELKEMYKTQAKKINTKVGGSDRGFCDSGFDLFVPQEIKINKNELFKTVKIDHMIKTEMILYDEDQEKFISKPYYLYPRSSISKTPLTLANNVGIIDSSYRGNVIAAVRCLYMENENAEDYTVEKYTRMFQICYPTLEPFQVDIVDSIDKLSNTERGTGGFGSTGLVGLS